MPPTTASVNVVVGIGRAKYEPEKNAVVWRVKRFPGGSEVVLNGEILVILMIEDMAGVDNLDDILTRVPGIGVSVNGSWRWIDFGFFRLQASDLGLLRVQQGRGAREHARLQGVARGA